MAFEVLITDTASADLDTLTSSIQRRASVGIARKWFMAILATLETLQEMPERCSAAEESNELEAEIRVLLFGRRNRQYRIYFEIRREAPSSGTVRVFHIRHWARQRPDIDELGDLMDEVLDQ